MSDEKFHYRISPSATSRIEKCPGSLRLSDGVPSKSSKYADEGTLAHSVGEIALRTGEAPKHDSPEIVEAITHYVQFCRSILYSNLVVDYAVEYRSEHATILGFGGTVDFFCIYEEDSKKVLHIVDYKHGAGVFVSEKENRQLMSYAAICLSNHANIGIEKVVMSIVQPRAKDCQEPIRTWECSVEEILIWETELQNAIAKNDLVTGDHCRWCPAKLLCPAIRDVAFQAAQTEFEVIRTTKDEKVIEDQVGWLLELDRMSSAIKSVLEEVRPTLLWLMQQGTKIPEMKAVKAFSNRSWGVSNEELKSFFQNAGLQESDYMESEFISPAKAEKLLGVGTIDSLTTRRETGLRVVPASEKGEPVNLDVFSDNSFESIW